MQIYLDIDGVMIPANAWRKPEILEDGFFAFDPRAVRAFNAISSNKIVEIILTTSHRHSYSLLEWKKILEARNIRVDKITRLPKNNKHLSRKEELLRWFRNNEPKEDILIIDDDKSLNGLPNRLKDRLLQTSGSVGLTENHVEEALHCLEDVKVSMDNP